MATELKLIDEQNTEITIIVTQIGHIAPPAGYKSYLWKYAAVEFPGHDLFDGMIISAVDFDTANKVFLEVLKKDDSISHEYNNTEWYCRCEAIDLYPDRDIAVVQSSFIHA